MKKNKAQPKGRKAQEYKPWLLMNVSPNIREMAKGSAEKHNMKVAEWVINAIIKTHRMEEEQTVDIETFAEFTEEYHDKDFIKNLFLVLSGKIEDLSGKIDGVYKSKVERKPWWKFWS
jgi:hypothetical protein